MPKINGKYIIPFPIGIESEVIVPDYTNDETLEYWCITSDPSIDEDGEGKGVEYYSSVLHRLDIWKALKELEGYSKENNFKVNKTCGVHVHIGTPWTETIRQNRTKTKRNKKAFYKGWQKNKRVAALYAILEPLIFSLIPDSRLNNSMTYPLTTITSASNITKMNVKDFITFLFGRSIYLRSCSCPISKFGEFESYRNRNTRYYAVNFNASLYYGTIEFRMHGASTNAGKIYHWIKFLSSIVEASQSINNCLTKDIYNPRKVFKTILGLDKSTTKFLLRRLERLSEGRVRSRIMNKKHKIKRMRGNDPYLKLKQIQSIIHEQATKQEGQARILDNALKDKSSNSFAKMLILRSNLSLNVERKIFDDRSIERLTEDLMCSR